MKGKTIPVNETSHWAKDFIDPENKVSSNHDLKESVQKSISEHGSIVQYANTGFYVLSRPKHYFFFIVGINQKQEPVLILESFESIKNHKKKPTIQDPKNRFANFITKHRKLILKQGISHIIGMEESLDNQLSHQGQIENVDKATDIDKKLSALMDTISILKGDQHAYSLLKNQKKDFVQYITKKAYENSAVLPVLIECITHCKMFNVDLLKLIIPSNQKKKSNNGKLFTEFLNDIIKTHRNNAPEIIKLLENFLDNPVPMSLPNYIPVVGISTDTSHNIEARSSDSEEHKNSNSPKHSGNAGNKTISQIYDDIIKGKNISSAPKDNAQKKVDTSTYVHATPVETNIKTNAEQKNVFAVASTAPRKSLSSLFADYSATKELIPAVKNATNQNNNQLNAGKARVRNSLFSTKLEKRTALEIFMDHAAAEHPPKESIALYLKHAKQTTDTIDQAIYALLEVRQGINLFHKSWWLLIQTLLTNSVLICTLDHVLDEAAAYNQWDVVKNVIGLIKDRQEKDNFYYRPHGNDVFYKVFERAVKTKETSTINLFDEYCSVLKLDKALLKEIKGNVEDCSGRFATPSRPVFM